MSELAKYLSFIPRTFKLSNSSAICIILGYLCGFPSGAKALDTMLANKRISYNEAYILSSFVNNCSPIFILTTVGISMLGSIKIGILLLFSHFASSILFGIIHSRIYSYNIIHDKNIFSIINNKKQAKNRQNESPILPNFTKFEIIQKSIINTFTTLSFILGFMVIFNLLGDIISHFLTNYNLIPNVLIINLFSGIFEMTKGVKNISSSTNLYTAIISISFLLGFSGLSVIFQLKSCFKNLNITIMNLVIFKFMHGIFSAVITYILLKYTNLVNMNITVFASIHNVQDFRKSVAIAYAHSLSLILLILSTFILIRNEKKYMKK